MPRISTDGGRTLPPDLAAQFDQAAVLLAGSPDGIPEQLAAARKVATEPGTRVVLLGPFSAGKSTLINALLGSALMKTDANPSTAIPTVVSHGPHIRITGVTADGKEKRLTQEAYQRASAVDSPASVPLRFARMQVPAAELADGLELVDLPGLFDQDERDEVTKEFLHSADVVLAVTPAVSGLTLSERAFLSDLAALGIRNLILLVTKLDRVEPSEVPGIRTRAVGLAAAAGIPAERVILVAAKRALTKQAEDAADPADHGMTDLVAALRQLTGETGAAKDARAAQRLTALVAQAREQAGRGSGSALTTRLIKLAELETRCLAAMTDSADPRTIGQFVRGLQPVTLPPPGPERAGVVLRTALAAVKASAADGTRLGIGQLETLTGRVSDAGTLAPGDVTQLKRALTKAAKALAETSDELRTDLGKLAQADKQVRRLAVTAPDDVKRQLKRTAGDRMSGFRKRVKSDAEKWAGSPDSSLTRGSAFSWRDTVYGHVGTVTQRLLDQFTAKYRTFVSTDLRQRLQAEAQGLVAAANDRAKFDKALDSVNGILAGMKARRALAPARVQRPAGGGLPRTVPSFSVPSLSTDDFPDLARKARDDKLRARNSFSWGVEFVDFGPQAFLRIYFTPPVLNAFKDWSGKAVHRALDKRVGSWADKVAGIVAEAATERQRELAAGAADMASACAAASADTHAELVRTARLSAELSALRQCLNVS